METIWVVVAESARARILRGEGRTCRDLTDVEALAHGASRFRTADLVTDRPGRGWASASGEGRHGIDIPTDPTEQERERFAEQIVDRLQAAQQAGAFQHLAIVAAPAFLGILRAKMTPALAATVCSEIARNVVKLDDTDALRTYLPDFLY
jgi:protein required for attachment to host cells